VRGGRGGVRLPGVGPGARRPQGDGDGPGFPGGDVDVPRPGSGYPTEAEHLLGDMVDRARQLDVPTPLLELATVAMRVYENKLAGK
jgi:hypothetical protein